MLLGGIGLLVVVVLIIISSQGGGESGGGKDGPAKAATPDIGKTQTPAKPPVQLGAATSGKTPGRAAPALTTEMLGKVTDLKQQMEAHYNDGSKARTAGDNAAAREHQAKAKDMLDQIDKLIEPQLLWQEEAEMGGWAQPAEYVALAKLYGSVSKLAKMVRMGGGK